MWTDPGPQSETGARELTSRKKKEKVLVGNNSPKLPFQTLATDGKATINIYRYRLWQGAGRGGGVFWYDE